MRTERRPGRIGRFANALVHSGRHVLWANRAASRASRSVTHAPISRRLIEERARRYLDMTAEEFYAAMDAGTLPDTPAVTHLKMLAGAPRR
jgi:hypothetical protein